MRKLTFKGYIDALIEAADDEMRRGKVEPESPFWVRDVLDAWKKATPLQFAQLALLAGLTPPRQQERDAFLRQLEARVPAAQRAS